ncbi:MAG: type II toxin-antitoxin system HipA family toxin [Bacteroidales bacterium]|nr:type II toxin-antitoxin system HipA family toxin [Bacteroidales bacterium]
MAIVEKLLVSLDFGNNKIEVGELAISKSNIYFKYYPDFINLGIEISPFKMPLSTSILSAESEPFDSLFGVFNDSLPDGWGRLLLDRKLNSETINISTITPLDRLAYVGLNGMGALCYQPEIKSENENLVLELDNIANEMKRVLDGFDTDILDKLYQLGGSSGGARPKIFIGFNPKTQHIIQGTDRMPKGYEHWIIKFPSSTDSSDIANIEYAYYKMALDAGIEMNTCKLFIGKSGRMYFGTKRFDRIGNDRLHMHSASGLMHDNFRLSTMDYGHLMDCAFRLENHIYAYDKIFRLASFNVFAHNRDDHSKNFSFLMNNNGVWIFAPAYDLTFSYSSHGHHSTMISGESKTPGTNHLIELAEYFGMSKAANIIEQVKAIVSKWKEYAADDGVSKISSNRIESVLQTVH